MAGIFDRISITATLPSPSITMIFTAMDYVALGIWTQAKGRDVVNASISNDPADYLTPLQEQDLLNLLTEMENQPDNFARIFYRFKAEGMFKAIEQDNAHVSEAEARTVLNLPEPT
jgi:hypothetical protein